MALVLVADIGDAAGKAAEKAAEAYPTIAISVVICLVWFWSVYKLFSKMNLRVEEIWSGRVKDLEAENRDLRERLYRKK